MWPRYLKRAVHRALQTCGDWCRVLSFLFLYLLNVVDEIWNLIVSVPRS